MPPIENPVSDVIEKTGDAVPKVAAAAQRFPWGFAIVIAICAAVMTFFVMNASNKNYKKLYEDEATESRQTHKTLDSILIADRDKNTIIYQQQQAIDTATSIIRRSTKQKAVKLLNQ